MNILDADNTVNFKNLFTLLWSEKILILSFTTIVAILSVIYALNIPNSYTSSALLVPEISKNGAPSQFSSFTSAASIAGLDLDNQDISKSDEAIARIKSYTFFTTHFLPRIKLEDIMAAEKWVSSTNSLIYDSSKFDSSNKSWVLTKDKNTSFEPSTQDAFQVYRNILYISENEENSFVSLAITHQSPYIAQEWVNIIIENINESMREEEIINSQNKIDFLNSQFPLTNKGFLQNSISDLLKIQMHNLMMASSNKAFVFRAIDHPIVPEKKSAPSRAFICIVGTFIGGMLSVIFVLLRNIRKNLSF
jgi:uncharacterized protein involved in exopolysaccharide biosynthesis